ncbi:MAG: fibronectin type III domain-containing protein, partial [Sediminibacterium sp.]|nr:fibronectin type III domain-containing protein [Sediminibacterium sp.]
TNGRISPQDTLINYGNNLIYRITPNTGYQIDSIKIDDIYQNNIGLIDTIKNIINNRSIRVGFKPIQYRVVTLSTFNGAIISSDTARVGYNRVFKYTISPIIGYSLDSLFIDNMYSLNQRLQDSILVTKDIEIRATFKIPTLIVRSSAGMWGEISFSGDTLINYGSSINYTFTPNIGYEIDSVILDGVKQVNRANFTLSNIITAHTIRVTFKRIRYTITGNVFGNQGRISTIRDTVDYGAKIRVTYQANSGYNLAYIIVDNTIINYDSLVGYTFTNITQNHSITPIFTFITIPNPPTNIIAVGGNGQATVGFTAPVNNGGAAINRYNISTTTGNITASGVGSPIIVTGLTNGTNYRFVVSATNAIGSSLSSDTSNGIVPRSSGKYINAVVVGGQITNTTYIDSGSNFVVTYTNRLGYVLDSIYINGMYSTRATADSTSQYTFKNVGADSAIKVVYKIRTYTITASAGNGGSIAPQGVSTVHYGEIPIYTITPNLGYVIDSVFVNNRPVNSINNNYIFDSVKTNQTIRAVFKLQTFTITSSAGNGGSIAPQGTSTVNYGDRPSYTITPNIGYEIDSITINGNKIANVNNIKLDSVKANQTIRVVFKIQTFSITASAGNGGSIAPQGTSNVNYGDRPSYTITPNTGYEIDSITINGNKVANVNNYKFDSVKANQ